MNKMQIVLATLTPTILLLERRISMISVWNFNIAKRHPVSNLCRNFSLNSWAREGEKWTRIIRGRRSARIIEIVSDRASEVVSMYMKVHGSTIDSPISAILKLLLRTVLEAYRTMIFF